MRLDRGIRQARDTGRKIVSFDVGDLRYGLDIMLVREIVNPARVLKMPSAPPYVCGVADHRAAVVPIVDLRVRFGLPAAEPTRRTKWIIVTSGGRDLGLVVDRVVSVVTVTSSERRDRHALLDAVNRGWVKDVYGTGQGLLFELDLESTVGLAAGALAEPPGGEGGSP